MDDILTQYNEKGDLIDIEITLIRNKPPNNTAWLSISNRFSWGEIYNHIGWKPSTCRNWNHNAGDKPWKHTALYYLLLYCFVHPSQEQKTGLSGWVQIETAYQKKEDCSRPGRRAVPNCSGTSKISAQDIQRPSWSAIASTYWPTKDWKTTTRP